MTEVGRQLEHRARRRIAPAQAGRQRERRIDDRLGHGWPLATAAAWVVGIGTILLLQPAPADPEAASTLGQVLALAVATGLSVTVLGLAGRYRFGLGAAAATGAAMLAASIACPVSGHHTFGTWWLAELGILAGLTTLGVVGYRRATGTGE